MRLRNPGGDRLERGPLSGESNEAGGTMDGVIYVWKGSEDRVPRLQGLRLLHAWVAVRQDARPHGGQRCTRSAPLLVGGDVLSSARWGTFEKGTGNEDVSARLSRRGRPTVGSHDGRTAWSCRSCKGWTIDGLAKSRRIVPRRMCGECARTVRGAHPLPLRRWVRREVDSVVRRNQPGTNLSPGPHVGDRSVRPEQNGRCAADLLRTITCCLGRPPNHLA
jgi:hypothetical protein